MGPMINEERLWGSLMELAEVGSYTDARTGLKGVNRLALTEADRLGRALVCRWFEEAGLQVRVDQIGNVYGRREGMQPELAPVLSGSHIDSVPTGGAFDGALGVLGALEVVRSLNERQVKTQRAVEIGFFTDEEGSRFGTDILGSAVACGRIPLEFAYALTDERGVSVRDALEQIGFLGSDAPRREAPHAFVEVHIEQGPVLAAAGVELGVVSGVQAISWQELTVLGKSAHAGTTPMALRKDAGLAAAKINVKLHEMTSSGEFGEDMRVTMGRIEPVPGRVNIVPAKLVCTVDLRNPEDEAMERAEAAFAAYLEALSAQMGIVIEARQTARTPRVRFDEQTQALIERKMSARGYRSQRILSGAGHDAQEFAAVCPSAMIFVPGEYDGISHNPREFSSKEACGKGVRVLCDVILELAGGA